MGTNGLTTRARLQLINIFVKTTGKFQKTGLIPNGLKIKNSSAITPVSEDFNTKWNEVLYNAGKKLVELLLYESSKVIAKIQVELDLEVRKTDPENYDRIYEKLNAKHARFRRGLEERRGKKCEKVKAHKNVSLSRSKTQETTEQEQKNSRDSENNETRDLPITVNIIHVTASGKPGREKLMPM